jgi:uncharacterized protein (DUF2062 family)
MVCAKRQHRVDVNQWVSYTRPNVSTFHSARRRNKLILRLADQTSIYRTGLPRGIGCLRVIAPVLPSHFALAVFTHVFVRCNVCGTCFVSRPLQPVRSMRARFFDAFDVIVIPSA